MSETNRTTFETAEFCFTPLDSDTTLYLPEYWKTVHEEVWRIIPGWLDYAVSTWGRVRRYTEGWHAKAGRILRPSGAGLKRLYPSLHLYRDGKRYTVNVHTLVAQAFILREQPEHVEVDHIDSDNLVDGLLDNRAANLQWVTKRRNNELSAERGRRPKGDNHYFNTNPEKRTYGTKNGMAGITETTALEIKRLLRETKMTAKQIAAATDTTVGTVYHIKCGDTWRWL